MRSVRYLRTFFSTFRRQRNNKRRRPLRLEPLEDRNLLAASDPMPLTALGDVLFFSANDGTHGRELWRSDGTAAGTRMLADVAPGSPGSDIRSAIVRGNDLFFVANDGTTGLELWKLDLTTEQFGLVRDIRSGGEGSFPIDLTVFNGDVYFSALDDVHGRELWKSDGTTAGTMMVTDLVPGIVSGAPSHLTVFGNELLFAADGVVTTGGGRKQQSSATGKELWKTNGTAAGTVLLKDMAAGSSSSLPTSFTEVNGKLFFTARGSTAGKGKTGAIEQGRELWVTDGTPQGTMLVKDIATGNGSSDPAFLTNVNGTLFFGARDATGRNGIWKSDGTAAGTQLALDMQIIDATFDQGPLPVAAGKIFFHSLAATGDLKLFAFEVATSNVTSIRSVLPAEAIEQGVEVSPVLENMGGTIFFTAFDPSSGLELWKVDPVTLQPSLVINIFPSNNVHDPSPIRLFGVTKGRFFFVADDGIHGRELWFSDGTTEGTHMVADIAP